MTKRIEVNVDNTPPEKAEYQKQLLEIIVEILDENGAKDDDAASVGLSLLGTVLNNSPEAIRMPLASRFSQLLVHAIEAGALAEKADRNGGSYRA